MQELKQSTGVDIRIGPAVDATDGVTPETTLALGSADQAELLKHNGAATVDISARTFAAVTGCDGWYDLTLTTADTNTLGLLDIVIQDASLCAPIFVRAMVVDADYYDAKYGTAGMPADVVSSGGQVFETGTALSGTTTTITLAAGASSNDLSGDSIVFTGGTGAGQGAMIDAYNTTTKVATLSKTLTTAPDATTTYQIRPYGYNVVSDANPIEAQVVDISTAGQGDIRTSLGMVAADLDTQLDALPTAAENRTEMDLNSSQLSATITHLTDIKGGTFSGATDSLEAIRDRGDAAWTTGAGGTPPDLLQSTTIATLTSQTVFTLTAGSADDDAYNGHYVVVTDQSTSTQKAVGQISDYVGSTRQVTLSADPAIFTMAVGDTVDVIASTGSGLDAAGTRAALGMASADLDTQLDALPTAAENRAEMDSNSTQLAAIVQDTGTDIPASITGLNDPTAAAIATQVWAEVCESQGSYTAQQVMSILLSVLAGRTSSGGDIFSTPNGGAQRVVATTDASNNRTAMTLTPSS
ncbi:MAG: hypothetical protein AB2792_23185 [Candidatus Thiodiazotropha sp.]